MPLHPGAKTDDILCQKELVDFLTSWSDHTPSYRFLSVRYRFR